MTVDGEPPPPLLYRAGSAFAYATASILIVFVNKILLTNYKFPSFLCVALGQMVATIVILKAASFLRIVSFPSYERALIWKIFPLPLLYVLNLVSGLGGTQKLSLPMFTVLRRFSILMTMVLEYIILGTKASFAVKISVALMIFGSVIAAIYDLSFDAYGYFLILINDICTAANGVYMKQKLEAKELGKYGLLYYNALFMLVPVAALVFFNEENKKVEAYIDEGMMTAPAIACLLGSFVCGFILNYTIVLCTHFNSALTTTCVGPIKNLFVTYVGMLSSGDYIFQWTNFIGINVSVMGSILYTYVVFRLKNRKSREVSINALPINRDEQPLI